MDRNGIPGKVVWLLAAGLISVSFSPILVRIASEAPSSAVAVWRTLAAVALLAPAAFARRGSGWTTMTSRNKGLTVIAGVCLGLHLVAWIESIYHTSVSSATVLFTTNPLFIAVMGYFALGERLKRSTMVAILIAVIGASLIGLGDAGDDRFPRAMQGNSLAIIAAVLFSVYLLIGRVTRQSIDWLGYVFPLYVVVACTTIVYALILGVSWTGYSWEVYMACAAMAIGPQIIGHGSLNYAVRYLPVALLGILGLVEPLLASIWAWIIYGEVPGSLAIAGMMIVLSALLSIYFWNLSEFRSENRFLPRIK